MSTNPVDLRERRAVKVTHVSWPEFLARHFRWYAGEHIGIIGPTNAGKTTLMLALLPMRKYVVAIGTKPRDKTLSALRKVGYVRLKEWEPFHPETAKRLFWPDARKLDSGPAQQKAIGTAMFHIYREGRWCVAIDELWYVINMLKLERTIKTFLLQARSLEISLVLATQRPVSVPLELYDQSTHLFFFRDNDERNLNRLSGISWLSASLVRRTVAHLDAGKHEVLYINTRTGEMIVTIAPPPGKAVKG